MCGLTYSDNAVRCVGLTYSDNAVRCVGLTYSDNAVRCVGLTYSDNASRCVGLAIRAVQGPRLVQNGHGSSVSSTSGFLRHHQISLFITLCHNHSLTSLPAQPSSSTWHQSAGGTLASSTWRQEQRVLGLITGTLSPTSERQ